MTNIIELHKSKKAKKIVKNNNNNQENTNETTLGNIVDLIYKSEDVIVIGTIEENKVHMTTNIVEEYRLQFLLNSVTEYLSTNTTEQSPIKTSEEHAVLNRLYYFLNNNTSDQILDELPSIIEDIAMALGKFDS